LPRTVRVAGWAARPSELSPGGSSTPRGHHRLTIDPSAENARAIRTYTSLGFRPVGLLRAYERWRDGSWHDGLLMDLLADDLR
jgi:aminoglycoside 6'-N-acetyltransferase